MAAEARRVAPKGTEKGRRVFKSLTGLGQMLRQAQQMGSRMQEVNQRLGAQRVTGAAGGGMVTVEASGLGQVLRVSLDPQMIDPAGRELLEDLVVAAVNDALMKAKELHVESMKSLTEGIDLPGLDGALDQFLQSGQFPGQG